MCEGIDASVVSQKYGPRKIAEYRAFKMSMGWTRLKCRIGSVDNGETGGVEDGELDLSDRRRQDQGRYSMVAKMCPRAKMINCW